MSGKTIVVDRKELETLINQAVTKALQKVLEGKGKEYQWEDIHGLVRRLSAAGVQRICQSRVERDRRNNNLFVDKHYKFANVNPARKNANRYLYNYEECLEYYRYR